jgi:TIR domain
LATLYLSYKDEEKAMAKVLADELSKLGHEAVYDAVAVAPGQNWRDVLMRALHATDVVVVLLTERAMLSPFVMGEIGAARALGFGTGKPLLLPVLVDGLREPQVISDLFSIRMQTDASGLRSGAHEIDRTIREHFSRLRSGHPRLFISHRHKDSAVVEALVRLLEAAFEVTQSDLRCTSVQPYRLKAGDRFAERLRTELQSAEAVLGIISPDVKESSYVLFELGASWGRSGRTFPLLISGATAADVPAPIHDLHTLSLLSEHECHQLIDDLGDVTSLPKRERQKALVAQRVQELVSVQLSPSSNHT